MKVRVLGTGTMSYFSKFMEIPIATKKVVFIKRGKKIMLCDIENELYLFEDSAKSTVKQYVEIWEAFGWLRKELGAMYLIEMRDYQSLLKLFKSALVGNHSDEKTKAFINMKLLALEHASRNFSEHEIENWKIEQLKGKFSLVKLKSELSNVEKSLLGDTIFMSKVREKLYAQINEEL